MKKSRFSEAQIGAILQRRQSGQTVAHTVRKYGISEATFYTWKTNYAGLQVNGLMRLRHLEANNQRLKEPYAELSVENYVGREVLRKK